MKAIHRLLAVFVAVLVAVSLVVPAGAAAQAEDGQLVYDYAGLLSEEQARELNQFAREVSDKHWLSVVILTTEDTQGLSSGDYAAQFFDDNALGYDGGEDGILLLINMQEQELFINTTGSVIEEYDDGTIQQFVDWLIDDFVVNGDYAGACDGFIDEVDQWYSLPDTAIPTVDSSKYIHDLAGLLTSSQVSGLESSASQLKQQYGLAMVVAIIESDNGYGSEAYADDFFDSNNFGNDGALLLINMEPGELHLSTAGSAVTAFDDAAVDNILDQVADAMGSGQAYKACQAFFNAAQSHLQASSSGNNPGTTGGGTGGRNTANQGNPAGVLVGLVFIGVILLFVGITRMSRRGRTSYGYGGHAYHDGYYGHRRRRFGFWRPRHAPPPRHMPPPPPRPSAPPPPSRSATTHTSSSGKTHGGSTRSFGSGTSSSNTGSSSSRTTTRTSSSGTTHGGGGSSFGSSRTSSSSSRPSTSSSSRPSSSSSSRPSSSSSSRPSSSTSSRSSSSSSSRSSSGGSGRRF